MNIIFKVILPIAIALIVAFLWILILDPELDNKVNYTANQAQSRDIQYTLCNTFGFGGHNASIIFKKI